MRHLQHVPHRTAPNQYQSCRDRVHVLGNVALAIGPTSALAARTAPHRTNINACRTSAVALRAAPHRTKINAVETACIGLETSRWPLVRRRRLQHAPHRTEPRPIIAEPRRLQYAQHSTEPIQIPDNFGATSTHRTAPNKDQVQRTSALAARAAPYPRHLQDSSAAQNKAML